MRLILPYINDSGVHEANTLHADNFGKATLTQDNVADFSSLNLQSKIILKAGKTIKNYGAITIAGELTAGGTNTTYSTCGNTARNYAKLVLEDGAKIESTGTIYCFGLIDESKNNNKSSVLISSGTIYMPFIIRGFRGGSYFNTNKDSGVSPFNEFEFRNVIPKLRINYGSTLIGLGNIYAGSKINYTPINFVGSSTSYVVELKEGSYLEAKYNAISKTDLNDKWADGVSEIHFYGNVSSNSLQLSIKVSSIGSSVTVSTSSCHFPISWRQHIYLHSGNFTMNQKFKIMTGSKFTICEDAILTALDFNIYESFTDTLSLVAHKYPTMPAAEFNLYGELHITKIGGKINIGKNAKLEVSTYGNSTQEVVTAVKSSSLSTSYTQTYQQISTDALYLYYTVIENDKEVIKEQKITEATATNTHYVYSQTENKWVIQTKAA